MGDRTADPRQIMLNLIGNAVKFTEHGKIAIRAQCRKRGRTAQASLVMDVEDSGIGIAADRQDA